MNRPAFLDSAYSLYNSHDHSALILASEECPECDGEGYFFTEVPGGYYSAAQGQWFPDERETECENCNGTGIIEESRCGRCGKLEDYCECDEDEITEWEVRIHDLVNQAISNAETGMSEERVTWNEAHYITVLRETLIDYIDGEAIVQVYATTFRGAKEKE
jgi:RecJ-like exonuclease